MIGSQCVPLDWEWPKFDFYDEAGAFRVIYIATRDDAVYVLHAFQKKTERTAKRDLDIAVTRLKQI